MMIITYAMFQRKFARESQEAKQDTFNRFHEWLNKTFVSSIPSEEWQHIMEKDEAHNYAQSTRNAMIVIPVMIVLVELATLGMRIVRKIVILVKDMQLHTILRCTCLKKNNISIIHCTYKYLDKR